MVLYIGGWISKQRTNKKKNKLSQDKIDKLESLKGWFWEVDFDEAWNEKYEILKQNMLDNNNQCPAENYKTECGINIGVWISTQRQLIKRRIN